MKEEEKEEAAARAERERKLEEQTFRCSTLDYITALPPELRENFKAALDQIYDQREYLHDNKLPDTDLAWATRGEGEWQVEVARFDMPLVWLLEAGVPRAMIEYQRDHSLRDPADPKTVFKGWIEIRGGSHSLWNDGRGWSIDPDEPTAFYPAHYRG